MRHKKPLGGSQYGTNLFCTQATNLLSRTWFPRHQDRRDKLGGVAELKAQLDRSSHLHGEPGPGIKTTAWKAAGRVYAFAAAMAPFWELPKRDVVYGVL